MKTSKLGSRLSADLLPAKAHATATETKEAVDDPGATIEVLEAKNWEDTTVVNESVPDPEAPSEETPAEPVEETEAEAPETSEQSIEDQNWNDFEGAPAEAEPEKTTESDDGGEPTPEVAEETVTETSSEAEVTSIDPHLLSGARELGFTDVESGKLHQAGMLESAMSRVLAASRDSLNHAASAATETPETVPDTIEIDPELYDAETIEKLKAQNAVVERQNQTINAMREENAQADARQAQDDFNGFISDLGSDWEPVFGKGVVEEGTPAFVNRNLLIQKSIEQGAAMKAAGTYPDKLSGVFSQGLRMAFGQHETKLATDKLSAQVKSRSNQILSKPGKPTKTVLSPRQAAEQAVQKIAKDAGFEIGSGGNTDHNWNS